MSAIYSRQLAVSRFGYKVELHERLIVSVGCDNWSVDISGQSTQWMVQHSESLSGTPGSPLMRILGTSGAALTTDVDTVAPGAGLSK